MPARILIVDDDDAMLRLLERRLQSAGYEVLKAVDGEEAIRVALVEKPPIVITDWAMPHMSGLEFCRVMRSLPEIGFIYIIVLTAHSEEERVVEAFEAGADDFLHKPLNQQELLARLKAALRIIKLEEDLDLQNRSIRAANLELMALNRKLDELARTDPLTGLANRREAVGILDLLWREVGSERRELTCLLVDIDHFKQLNDRYGHDFGDRALCEMARTLRSQVDGTDTVCRVGGEEFLIISPNRTAESAMRLANDLCRESRSRAVSWNGISTRMTISIGVARRNELTHTPQQLLKKADEALYAAKQAGRNCVRAAGQRPEAAEPASLAGTDDSREAVGGPFKTAPRVLIADDDPSVRTLCRRFLETAGYQVTEAVDGLDALNKVITCYPDVLVLDGIMPELNGLDCARKLKADPGTRDIPIIMASALGEEDDIVAGLEAGVDEYITKPIRRREFVLRVQTMARLYRNKLELLHTCEVRDEQANALAVLLDYSASLSASHHLDSILERTVAIASRLLRSRRVGIMLPEPETGELVISRAVGMDAETAAAVRVPRGSGIAGRVFETGEAVIVNAPTEQAVQPSGYDASFFASVPLACQPLIGPEVVIGVLNVTQHEGDRPFEARELKYLQLIASIAAAAIDDAVTRRARDEARDTIVGALATLAECRDADTGRHLDRVTRFSLILAEELRKTERFAAEINDAYLYDLKRAMPLHDIGKVAVPDCILLKPGKLSQEEMVQMRRHAEIGGQAISSVIGRAPGVRFLSMAEEIARSHHEWFDGSGYPYGLGGDAIPLCARIAALADVYDALTTRRPYKNPFSHSTAVEIIRNSSGTQFDPDIAEAFLRREQDFHRVAAELADEEGTVGAEGAAPAPAVPALPAPEPAMAGV